MQMTEKQSFKKIKHDGLEYFKVAPGVWGMKIVFVNIYIICEEVEGDYVWYLVDAGLKGSGEKIRKLAEHLFEPGTKPAAILLTHGHFDHVGALEELLGFWDVPVYAHSLEMPYLKGISCYPPPDPMVGGGLMSLMSWMYPKEPKNLDGRVKVLADEEVPGLTEWKYIHVPGHSPGQVAFYRENDKLLIAADAFVTTKQESAFSVLTQKQVLSGPPQYFTIDWLASEQSVMLLAAMKPEIAATGHGYPMYGEELQLALDNLSMHFKEEAVPSYGRYVREPARANKNGVQYIPKRVNNPFIVTGALVVGAIATLGMFWGYKKRFTS